MRLTTWNVNGIRNPFSYLPWSADRTFPAMFDRLESDIVVMQELKIQRKDLRDDMVIIDGWDCYFSLPKHKKGYSGVGIYTRNATCAPIRAEEGLLGVLPSPSGVPHCDLPEDQSIGGYPSAFQIAELGVDPVLLDAEGRCVVVEFPAFVLFGVYSPANSNGLRDDFRYGFICALDCRIRNLIKLGKRVVLVGDLNVSSNEIDGASAKDDCKKAGITHEEYISTPNRRIFNQLLLGGEVVGERDEGREHGVLWDTTRGFHPHREGMYTHWEVKINARPGNFGSRIDYVLVSEGMRPWIRDADIQSGLHGSDHCPVYADFHDEVDTDTGRTKLLDIMSPIDTFENGIRTKNWTLTDTPAYSAKRMPEFDKRRSIKSMFAATVSKRQPTPPRSEVEDRRAAESSQSRRDSEAQQSAIEAPVPIEQTTITPSASTLSKRKAPVVSKSSKRTKTDAAPPTFKGQQSLKGFFSKASADGKASSQGSPLKEQGGDKDTDIAVHEAGPTGSQPSPAPSAASSVYTRNSVNGRLATPVKHSTLPAASEQAVSPSPDPSPSKYSEKIAAAEQSQRSWGALFSRPAAPLCEDHQEPCKTMQTKKKGSNQGRSFWMCARPLGPSGEKERGTEWRCPTFIWCSDWGRKTDGG